MIERAAQGRLTSRMDLQNDATFKEDFRHLDLT